MKLLRIGVLVFLISACSENSETRRLQETVDSLKVTIQQQEYQVDSILWRQTVLSDVNVAYEKLLERKGLQVSYSIHNDSSITIEVIEDEEMEH